MSIERGAVSFGIKVGEDWSASLTFTTGTPPVAFDWSGVTAKMTLRYGPGEKAAEAFTLSSPGAGIVLSSGGVMTLSLGRDVSVRLRTGVIVGDLLIIDAAGRSLPYLDVSMTVSPRSTVR